MQVDEDKNGNVHYLPGPMERRPDILAAEIETLGCLLVGIPNPDPHSSATQLVESFGSLTSVLHADVTALARHGLNSGQILILQSAARAVRHVSWSRIENRQMLASWSEVQHYLMTRLAHLRKERFMLLTLDNRNRLIAAHDISHGTIDQTPVYIRELAQTALNDFAKNIILAHNHPSGEAQPSRADIDMTADIRTAMAAIGITLHDHLIITPTDCISFKSLGLL